MKHSTTRQIVFVACSLFALLGALAQPVSAQAPPPTFSSGSNGSLGAFSPAANTTVTLPPDGVLHYTTVTIPSGVIVTFAPNAANTPVTMLATGTVTIAGTINLNGAAGANYLNGTVVFSPGGVGGPGGFAGGQGNPQVCHPQRGQTHPRSQRLSNCPGAGWQDRGPPG